MDTADDNPERDEAGDAPSPPDPERIADALAAYERRLVPVGPLRPASVLVPLIERPEGLHLVLTLRPRHLPHHAGQVSFPGGGVATGDRDRWHTALREAHEELSIPPEVVRPLGQLDDYPTITQFHVTPCVGLLPRDLELVPDPGEVERVFTVPLAHVLRPERVRTARMTRGAFEERLYFYDTGEEVVWGVTAAILTNFLDLLRRP